MRKKQEEQIIQRLPYRCPYCDQTISYEPFHLQMGENEILCPSCKKRYIKVVSDIFSSPSSSFIKRKKISLCSSHKRKEKKGSPTQREERILKNFYSKGKKNKGR